MKKIFEEIAAERARQDAKWNEQNHDNATWALIAGEELGEVQQAILHDEWGGDHAGTLREELVQLGAVVVAWLECLDREGGGCGWVVFQGSQMKCVRCEQSYTPTLPVSVSMFAAMTKEFVRAHRHCARREEI